MKNLTALNPDKLEELPNKGKRVIPTKGGCNRNYFGNAYPYKRIYGFLKSNVGKPWDEVYSKYHKVEWLEKHFKTLEWISHCVFLNTSLKDGKIFYFSNWRTEESPIETADDSFYIHPKTRILCYQPKTVINWKKKREKEQEKYMRILGDFHQLLKLNGIWYEVKGEPEKSDIVEHEGLHYRITNLKPRYKTRVCVFNGKVMTDLIPPDEKNFKIIDGKICVPCTYRSEYSRNKLDPKAPMINDDWDKISWRQPGGLKITLRRQLTSKELKKHNLVNETKVPVRCKICGGIAGIDCKYHICRICGKYNKDHATHHCFSF